VNNAFRDTDGRVISKRQFYESGGSRAKEKTLSGGGGERRSRRDIREANGKQLCGGDLKRGDCGKSCVPFRVSSERKQTKSEK